MLNLQLFNIDILENIIKFIDKETIKKIINFKNMKLIKYLFKNISFDNKFVYDYKFVNRINLYNVYSDYILLKNTIQHKKNNRLYLCNYILKDKIIDDDNYIICNDNYNNKNYSDCIKCLKHIEDDEKYYHLQTYNIDLDYVKNNRYYISTLKKLEKLKSFQCNEIFCFSICKDCAYKYNDDSIYYTTETLIYNNNKYNIDCWHWDSRK